LCWELKQENFFRNETYNHNRLRALLHCSIFISSSNTLPRILKEAQKVF
jgi:hypothetical protein